MRNLYNGRTDRPVIRTIRFENYSTAARFVNLYKDLFYKPVESCAKSRSELGFNTSTDFNGNHCLSFSLFKDDWNEILRHVDLEYVGFKQRVWKFKNEVA